MNKPRRKGGFCAVSGHRKGPTTWLHSGLRAAGCRILTLLWAVPSSRDRGQVLSSHRAAARAAGSALHPPAYPSQLSSSGVSSRKAAPPKSALQSSFLENTLSFTALHSLQLCCVVHLSILQGAGSASGCYLPLYLWLPWSTSCAQPVHAGCIHEM